MMYQYLLPSVNCMDRLSFREAESIVWELIPAEPFCLLPSLRGNNLEVGTLYELEMHVTGCIGLGALF